MNATTRVERALQAVLMGDEDLLNALMFNGGKPDPEQLIWKGMAPPDVEPPFVVFSDSQASNNETGGCGGAFLSRSVYQVKVIGNGTLGDVAQDLETAADRISELLSGWTATEDGYRITTREIGPVNYSEPTGDRYTHLGGLYEFTAVREPA